MHIQSTIAIQCKNEISCVQFNRYVRCINKGLGCLNCKLPCIRISVNEVCRSGSCAIGNIYLSITGYSQTISADFSRIYIFRNNVITNREIVNSKFLCTCRSGCCSGYSYFQCLFRCSEFTVLALYIKGRICFALNINIVLIRFCTGITIKTGNGFGYLQFVLMNRISIGYGCRRILLCPNRAIPNRCECNNTILLNLRSLLNSRIKIISCNTRISFFNSVIISGVIIPTPHNLRCLNQRNICKCKCFSSLYSKRSLISEFAGCKTCQIFSGLILFDVNCILIISGISGNILCNA